MTPRIAGLIWLEIVDYTSRGVMKPVAVPTITPVLNNELESLPLPNEILLKIFGYLDIQDISRSARVSYQFNMISKDSSLWKSLGKLCIHERKVPSEFLTYVIQRGITELSLHQCEILPPKMLEKPLKLRTLKLDGTGGDKTLINELLTSQPMEKIDFKECSFISDDDISHFIRKLPEIGSQLKNLNLENKFAEYDYFDLDYIALIVDACVGLEELNLSSNTFTGEAIEYLCENLTPNILKLNLEMGDDGLSRDGLKNENLMKLVESCPNLKVLDVRSNEQITYQGLVAIIENLSFLEYLGLPESIADELGLPNNVNLPRLRSLRSMKKLKELLIGDQDIWDIGGVEYKSILEREIPLLRRHNGDQMIKNIPNDLEVAMTDTEDFKEVEFCPNCLGYENDVWSQHECLKK